MAALLDDFLVILLAGGAGERLYPLTKERAKPAVYFGGPYRIVDFTLSNCINSGLRRIFICTQYKSLSLNRHIRMGWNVVSEELGEFIEILAPQKRFTRTCTQSRGRRRATSSCCLATTCTRWITRRCFATISTRAPTRRSR